MHYFFLFLCFLNFNNDRCYSLEKETMGQLMWAYERHTDYINRIKYNPFYDRVFTCDSAGIIVK